MTTRVEHRRAGGAAQGPRLVPASAAPVDDPGIKVAAPDLDIRSQRRAPGTEGSGRSRRVWAERPGGRITEIGASGSRSGLKPDDLELP